nr:MAG TPA: hypothetical protein [Caudoviricetes sp.]
MILLSFRALSFIQIYKIAFERYFSNLKFGINKNKL